MKIHNSSILLTSDHTRIEQRQTRQHLKLQRLPTSLGQNGFDQSNISEKVDIGLHEKFNLSQQNRLTARSNEVSREATLEDMPEASLKIRILKKMIERLTGKVLEVHYPQQVRSEDSDVSSGLHLPERNDPPTPQLELEVSSTTYEYESTSFSGRGIIETTDGRKIDFSVELNMTREFMETQQFRITGEEELKDPLVLNFDGAATELNQKTFAFDIDLDGSADQLRMPMPGSGFLALDKNDDGRVNDGSELFGPTTGDGFDELDKYDEDRNGWIDENDSVFNRLRIWSIDSSGEYNLFALGEVDVGAIYLNHINTPFSIKDQDNAHLAEVRDSSIFVKEDGEVGTIQQVDLVV